MPLAQQFWERITIARPKPGAPHETPCHTDWDTVRHLVLHDRYCRGSPGWAEMERFVPDGRRPQLRPALLRPRAGANATFGRPGGAWSALRPGVLPVSPVQS